MKNDENLFVCNQCISDFSDTPYISPFQYRGFYTNFKVPEDKICPKCNSRLRKTQINGSEIKIIFNISHSADFILAMIDLKQSDPIEFQLKMSQFKANLSQTQATTEATNKIKCPKCGSTQITAGARGVNHFWGFIGASKTVNRCAKCGHTWKPQN